MRDRPGSVVGFTGEWSFHDIGTPADLLATSLALAAADGRPDRPRWGRGVRVDPSARVTRSVLWDDVAVGAGGDRRRVRRRRRRDDSGGRAVYAHAAIVAGPTGLIVAPL